jgi:hypothetical protein
MPPSPKGELFKEFKILLLHQNIYKDLFKDVFF